jgi:hypothetical protein
MPKRSADSLSIVSRLPVNRVPTPAGLSKKERDLWRAVVDSKPAEWFGPDSAPVLTEYVRAAVLCDQLARMVDQALKGQGADLKTALDLRDREARRLAALATKMRLTQQSRYTALSAATANKRAGGSRPWGDDAAR